MKKTKLLLASLCALFVMYVSQSCDKTETPNEYVADNSSFAGFMTWSLDKTFSNSTVGFTLNAHIASDSSVVRDCYFKDGQAPSGGAYPTGTLIVKHSHNSSANEYTGMAKRGNNYDATGGDWEYFVLTSSGTIATDSTGAEMRGANLMGGACKGCHSGATTDYVFSK